MRVVGICGSLRKDSYNRKLLKVILASLKKQGVGVGEASMVGISLYNEDVEIKGIPQAVKRFKAKIKKADGLVLVGPEYNNSISGVFKNAIDWASRPPADTSKVFDGKIVLLAGASTGNFATVRAQMHMRAVCRVLGMIAIPQEVLISNAPEAFDQKGNLLRESDIKQLERVSAKFIEIVRKLRSD